MIKLLMPASYSKLGTYETCPAKAKFKYIDKVEPLVGRSPNAVRGEKLHKSMEGFLKDEKTTVHKDLKRMHETLRRVKRCDPFVEEMLCFGRDFKGVLPWDSHNAWFRMVIDSAYINGNEIHVQEWKSGREYDDHADQRRLYALGALVRWAAMAEAIVTTYYVDKGTKLTLHVTRPQATILARAYGARIDRMEQEKTYGARPGRHCNWCDYSQHKGGPCKFG